MAHVRVGNTIRFNPADVSILVGVKRTTTVRATGTTNSSPAGALRVLTEEDFMGVASKVLEQSLKSAKT